MTVFLGGIAWHFTDVQSTSNNCCKSLPSGWGPQTHLDRWRILRRFFCNLRVRFFFHFQRNLERAWRHWKSFQQRGHGNREWRLKPKHLKFGHNYMPTTSGQRCIHCHLTWQQNPAWSIGLLVRIGFVRHGGRSPELLKPKAARTNTTHW